MWHNVKPTFVGAYWDKGFSSPLLLHVASALMGTLPFLTPFHLEYLWGYAYNNNDHGDANPAINIHADEAKAAPAHTPAHARAHTRQWVRCTYQQQPAPQTASGPSS